jgi:hypothetical protein
MRPSRSPFPVLLYLLLFFIPFHFNTHEENTPLSLSRRKRLFLVGRPSPIDSGPTEAIPGLTAMSSSIPSRYFINSFPLYPWISLPRVHNVKDENSNLDHGFIGLMVGIVL